MFSPECTVGVLLADGADGGGGREHGGGPVFRQDAEEGPGVRRPDGLALQHSQRADSCLSPTSPSRGSALNLEARRGHVSTTCTGHLFRRPPSRQMGSNPRIRTHSEDTGEEEPAGGTPSTEASSVSSWYSARARLRIVNSSGWFWVSFWL